MAAFAACFLARPRSVNGSYALPFIVDTGASLPFLVDRSLAPKLNLHGSGNSLTISPGDLKVERAPVSRIELVTKDGRANLNCASVYLADMSVVQSVLGKEHVAGIVGLPFFENITARLDFAAR